MFCPDGKYTRATSEHRMPHTEVHIFTSVTMGCFQFATGDISTSVVLPAGQGPFAMARTALLTYTKQGSKDGQS